MQWLMTSQVRRHHRRYGTSGDVWQGRFKSFPIERRRPSAAAGTAGVSELGDPVLDVLRYVERNPLRAGLVAAAEDWPWSSLRWWTDASAAPQWWRREVIWRPRDWLEIVNRPQGEQELAAIRQCVDRGRPYGSEAWVRRVAAAWGLQTALRPRGRPRKLRKK